MNKLLKDAIADAKAVRETALANAKVALEEAFAPKLQSMLSHKIKEEMEDSETMDDTSDEDKMEVEQMQKMAGIVTEKGDDESEDMDSEEDMEMDSEEDYEDSEEDMEMDSEEDMEMDSEEGMDSDDEVSDDDLEEILRELDSEEDMDMDMESEDPERMETEARHKRNKMMEDEEMEDEEEVDLEEIIRALREEDDEDMEMDMEDDMEDESKMETVQGELNEAYSVIRFLRTKLNEVNLLNAKLLFVNKLFKKGELTESQKVRIIETFDRAKNVREAKLIYATLSESVNKKASKPTKKRMNEGLASAPQSKTKIITNTDNVYGRFKTLVDYNKH